MLGSSFEGSLYNVLGFATVAALRAAYKKPPAIRVVSLGATDVEGDLGWKATFMNRIRDYLRMAAYKRLTNNRPPPVANRREAD
jgi:hypothetical protein